jgi:acyl-CoA synthetase (AMP-forming)/AMP-acid ligase II
LTPALPDLLARAVDRFGGDDYVVEWDRRVTFAEAEERSAALATQLLEAGVGKGTRIGILLPTGVDWALVWLACGRIGALTMLFPATYRPAELRRALRISDAAILIAAPTMLGKDYQDFLEETVPGLAGSAAGALRDPEVPYLRGVWTVGASTRPWAVPVDMTTAPSPAALELLTAVETEVSPADPLLVIYTSGSSADPKAVVHTHGATIRKVQEELGMALAASAPGRAFCAMPFFWVGGPQELLGALHSGAAIVTQDRYEIGRTLDLLEREHCTIIMGWPALLDQLLSHPDFIARNLSGVTVKRTGFGVFSSKGDPPNLGMTETFGKHNNREWFDYKVVDPTTGAELADGDEGEFCIRGFGLMAAFYKKEREETFDQDGYYHTGDRGYVEDGEIYFTGRYSEMIKSAGANVAPLEVEQALQALPEVELAFVVGVPDTDRGEAVAAVVVPAPGATLEVEDLRAHLRTVLSAYKVPRSWLVVDEEKIPRLPSGKPDKRSLRDWF